MSSSSTTWLCSYAAICLGDRRRRTAPCCNAPCVRRGTKSTQNWSWIRKIMYVRPMYLKWKTVASSLKKVVKVGAKRDRWREKNSQQHSFRSVEQKRDWMQFNTKTFSMTHIGDSVTEFRSAILRCKVGERKLKYSVQFEADLIEIQCSSMQFNSHTRTWNDLKIERLTRGGLSGFIDGEEEVTWSEDRSNGLLGMAKAVLPIIRLAMQISRQGQLRQVWRTVH